MTSVDRLLEQYATAYRSGDTDPWPYLDQVEGDERVELEQMMELFLLKVEPREWDPLAFSKSSAAGFVDQLVSKLLVPEQGWRELLPSMRLGMKMKREAVFAELARALDAKGKEEEVKVADYYNDMEQGNLDPRGVSDRVLEALSGIYGTTVDVLRRVGEATPPPKAGGAVFARSEDRDLEPAGSIEAQPRRAFSRITGKPDRIDMLFVDFHRSEPGR